MEIFSFACNEAFDIDLAFKKRECTMNNTRLAEVQH